jgi:hypothetical protein
MATTTRKRLDANQLAASIVAQAVGDAPMPNQAKARAGRKGGVVGGKKRMDALTDAERHELAMRGVQARKGAPGPQPDAPFATLKKPG